MKLQDRYDTALDLVLSEYGFTQKELSIRLMQKDIKNGSNGQLSNAKSKVDKRTGNKYQDGELNDQKLSPIVVELEAMLADKEIYLAADQSHYYREESNERFDPIYLNKVQIKLPYHIDGVVALHERLPRQHLQEAIKKSKRVRLLQTFITSMDDYEESFQTCLRNGGLIQILLIDPRGAAAKARTRGIGREKLNVEQAVMENFKTLVSISPDSGQLQIKFYDEIPGVDMIACDQLMFCGWYLHEQMAKSGCYLELIGDDKYPLAANMNKNWDSIWSVATPTDYSPKWPEVHRSVFRCHYTRDAKYYNFDMHINRFSNEVFITNTPSKEEFRGRFENDRSIFLSISVETVNKFIGGVLTEVPKRYISFLIYTGLSGLWEQQLSVGVSINVTLNGNLGGNLILIENLKKRPGRQLTEAEFIQIKMFLQNNEIKAEDIFPKDFSGLHSFLNHHSFNWAGKMKSLERIDGQFHLFYECKDAEGSRCICRRRMRVFGPEKRAVREVWKENRKHEYNVSISNHHHLLFLSLKEDILDSEMIYLKRIPPDWEKFTGLIYFVPVETDRKQYVAPALLSRSDQKIKDHEYMIYPNTPAYELLMENKYFRKTFGST